MRTLQTSFSGGEQSPEMFGNVVDPKLRSGAQTIRNFVCRPSGAVQRRPGTRYVGEVGDSTKKVRLIPFNYSIDQSLCVQVGEGYFRFHADGGTVLFATPRTVASIDTDPGDESITFTAQQAGLFTVSVFGFSGSVENTYDVGVTLVCP